MKPSEMRKPPARAIASRSGTAQWCSIRRSAAAESLGISSMMSQASSSSKAAMPSAAAWAPAMAPSSRPSSPSMPRPIRAPIFGADLDRLVLGEVAEVGDLDLPVGVLVHGERVDHADGVALAQALELGDDLAVELGVLEAQHDQLDRSDGHLSSSLVWVRYDAGAASAFALRVSNSACVIAPLSRSCLAFSISAVGPPDPAAAFT